MNFSLVLATVWPKDDVMLQVFSGQDQRTGRQLFHGQEWCLGKCPMLVGHFPHILPQFTPNEFCLHIAIQIFH